MSTALAEYKVRVRDHAWYARRFQRVKDAGTGQLIPLVYNEPQRMLDAVWQEQVAAGQPVRIIVLKARREGITTYVASRFEHDCATRRGRNAQIIAHDDDSTNEIFGIYRLMWEETPAGVYLSDGTPVQVRPEKRYSNRKELVFHGLRSQIRVATAGRDTGASRPGGRRRGSGIKRGALIHDLHCSEVAQWPNAAETLLAVLQTVDDSPDTAVILESTGNGVGDEFHRLWLDAIAGRSDYVPVFLSWLVFRKYRMPVPPEGLGDLDDEELTLREEHGADDEQLAWRRWAIRNKCGNSIDKFHQEYPTTWEEAFLVSGRPYFDQRALGRLRKHLRPPVARGRLVERTDPEGRRRLEFVRDPTGELSIWAWPKPTGCYTVGGDVAEGKETGPADDSHDYSVGEVYDRDTGEQAAEWRGRMDPDLFGVELVKLARFYNDAWLGPEANKEGLATCKAVVRERYYRLFERKRLDEREPEPTEKIGWLTNAQTRPVMLADMEELVREEQLIIRSEVLYAECWSFVRDATGRPGAQEGCHDDTVLGMAIAIQLHKLCPMARPLTPEEKRAREHKRRQATRPRVSKRTGY